MKTTSIDKKHILSETRNNIAESSRKTIVKQLNTYLATLTDLYTQTKHAHWNVRGREFYQLHKLFDELAGLVEPHIDPLAERITALGGIAHGTVRMAAAGSPLEEFPTTEADDDLGYLWVLADRFGTAGNTLREGIDKTDEEGDMVSSDLLTGIVHDLDKGLYFLEAHAPRDDS